MLIAMGVTEQYPTFIISLGIFISAIIPMLLKELMSF